jgi:hypothetical protein
MGGREWGMLLALAVVWGASFFFNGAAVRDLPSFTLVWARVAVAEAGPAVGPASARAPNAAGRLCVGNFLGYMAPLSHVLHFVLIVCGQHRIASGLASILKSWRPCGRHILRR